MEGHECIADMKTLMLNGCRGECLPKEPETESYAIIGGGRDNKATEYRYWTIDHQSDYAVVTRGLDNRWVQNAVTDILDADYRVFPDVDWVEYAKAHGLYIPRESVPTPGAPVSVDKDKSEDQDSLL